MTLTQSDVTELLDAIAALQPDLILIDLAVGLRAGVVMTAPVWSPQSTTVETRVFSVLREETAVLPWIPLDGAVVVADDPPMLAKRARELHSAVQVAGLTDVADTALRGADVELALGPAEPHRRGREAHRAARDLEPVQRVDVRRIAA